MRQKGTILAKRLSEDQVREILAVPDRTTVMGKRNYCILALVVGCSLRRRELADISVEQIQFQNGRWILANLCGIRVGSNTRSVPVPLWVKEAVDDWQTAAKIHSGKLLRAISVFWELMPYAMSDREAWAVVRGSAREIGMDRIGTHDLGWFRIKVNRPVNLDHIKLMVEPLASSRAVINKTLESRKKGVT